MQYIVDFWTKIQMYFQEYPFWVAEAVAGAFMGICIGFLARIFGRYLVFSALAFALAGALMQNAGLVTFHFESCASLIGLEELPSASWCFGSVMLFAKEHVAAFVFALLSFIVGWLLGG
ncbi:MAG: hypothetical protein UV79_C0005G0013 [candidate division TM6 bacterium GW2011_GWF2_43_17]|nr:MAG: hypothetical protein UV79_C0005G0013 [candidate division TM6 bacterium GW2011_GWF2_43_17]HAU30026.1 hypothetical protein [Candidatus Dependentiae bacterium]